MKIVTGYTGTAHITSNDDQGRNIGMFGDGNYILNVGGRFSGQPDDQTHFTIADGEGVMQGVHFRIEPGDTETLTIAAAASGKWRKDRIVARYTKNVQTGVETVTLMDLKGTEVSTGVTPQLPTVNTNNIRTGGSPNDVVLYELTVTSSGITGFQIDEGEYGINFIESLADLTANNEQQSERIANLENGAEMEEYSLSVENQITVPVNSQSGYYFVYGRLAMVAFNLDGRIAESGSQLLYTLPGTKKPTKRLYKNCIRRDGKKFVIEVRTNGTIYITNAEDSIPSDTALMRDQIIFPVEETE